MSKSIELYEIIIFIVYSRKIKLNLNRVHISLCLQKHLLFTSCGCHDVSVFEKNVLIFTVLSLMHVETWTNCDCTHVHAYKA